MNVVTGVLIVAALAAAVCVFEILSGVRIAAKLRRSRTFGMADLLLYRRLPTSDAVLLSNGGYLAIFEVAARDAGTYTDPGLSALTTDIGRALGRMDERFIAHLRDRHVEVREYDGPVFFPHPVLRWIDSMRRKYFEAGNASISRRYVSLSWIPPSTSERVMSEQFSRGAAKARKERKERSSDARLADAGEATRLQFESALSDALQLLRPHMTIVRRLGARTEVLDGVSVVFSELLEELYRQISGRAVKIRMPETLLALNSLLSMPMRGGTHLRVGEREVAIVVIKDLPTGTQPLALARLRRMGHDYELVTRWLPLSANEARKRVKGAFANWRMKAGEDSAIGDPFADSMAGDARTATGMLSDSTRFGLVSPCVIVRADTRAEVDQAAKDAVTCLDDLGFPAFVSRLTAEDDFFAMLSGDGYHGIRRYQMHQTTLAHIFSMNSVSSGPEHLGIPSLPADSPPFAYATSGREERALYRVSLSTEPPDLLHSLSIGGPGVGKSVSNAFMAQSMYGRVPWAGVSAIDRGASMYGLCQFLDAPFYNLLGRNSLGFALFANIGVMGNVNEQERSDIEKLLISFCKIRGVNMIGSREAAISSGMENMLALPPHLRSLTAFCELLADPEGVLRPALLRYTRAGRLGMTLDAERDSFADSRFSAIDLGVLWNEREPEVLVPVLLVMFHKLLGSVRRRRERSGNYLQHWMFSVDEAHTLLGHPEGEQFLSDTALLGRREKFLLALFSQTARHFVEAKSWGNLNASFPTRMYYRDTTVMEQSDAPGNKTTRECLAEMDLPEHGIAALPDLEPNAFLLHQPRIRELVEVNWRLDKATLAIIGHTDEVSNRWLDTMMENYPKTWKEEVLRARGVDEEAIRELLAMIAAHNSDSHTLATVS